MERTLIIIKPDAVQRGLSGEILRRFESRGLRIVGMKFMQVSRALAEKHFAIHQGKPFYEGLVGYITSAPVVVISLEGTNAIEAAHAARLARRTRRRQRQGRFARISRWRLAEPGAWFRQRGEWRESKSPTSSRLKNGVVVTRDRPMDF